MDEGSFYESANYASVKRLPVLFVCENNLYATESPLQLRQPAGTDLCERMRAFKINALRIDGNDVHEVYHATESALDNLRAGGGPFFLECMTYRWREHVGPHFDHELNRTYRTCEEVKAWMERCPLKRSAGRLTRLRIATPAQLETSYQAMKADVEKDIERARNAPCLTSPRCSTISERRGSPMRKMTYAQALSEGLCQAMERDPSIFVTGIGVDYPSGIFGSTTEAAKRFGPARVFDAPAMENALTE